MAATSHRSLETANNGILFRRISGMTFPPALILLIAHCAASNYGFPVIGLFALAPSSLFGTVLLYRSEIAASGAFMLSHFSIFLGDVTLALLLLGMLIPSWVMLAEPRDRSLVVLGTYGTVFMMINCGIHIYFALEQLRQLFHARTCDCACRENASGQFKMSPMASEYISIPGGNEEQGYMDRGVESVNDGILK